MSVIPQLSTSLGRKDQEPNELLAKQIAESNDKAAVKELIQHLDDKKLQSDCIKVLYETGYITPKLLSPYISVFLKLLTHKNNRMIWGAMIAINTATTGNENLVYEKLPEILDAMEKGSVITRDAGVGILVKLCHKEAYADDIFPLIIEQINTCPVNQLPMYAEYSLPIVNKSNVELFRKAISGRMSEVDKEPKVKRLEKVLKKAEKIK